MKKKLQAETLGVQEDIASIYSRLEADRQDALDRARENALFTIPALMPPDGIASGQRLHIPFQSIGSHGVNTVTAKLVQTLLPANNPVFRFSISDAEIEQLAEDANQRAGVEKKLNEIERAAMDEIEGLGIRAALTEATKQLVVCGNVLLYLPSKGNLKVFRLDRYVVQRDFAGNVLRVIIKETIAREVLPEDVQAMIVSKDELKSTEREAGTAKNEVDVYTVFIRKGEMMTTYQSVKGMQLPRSQGQWPLEKSPIMPLRWNYLHDEDYGRAYLDEYIGDLTAVENMSKNIREGIAAMTKFNPMVDPTGLTRAKDVAEAENLEIISGREGDVTMLQMNKVQDFKFAGDYLQTTIQRLQTAFMMNASATRQAERVTAEEFRSVVKDIDDTLGGVYSLLANELQKPLVAIILHRMEKQKKIPRISSLKGADGKSVANPKIVTGIEALGRGHDYNKYRTFMTEIIAPLKEAGMAELNLSDLINRAAISLSIDTDGLLKSEEQKAQAVAEQKVAQEQAMKAQMMQDAVKGAAPALAREGAAGVAQQLAQGNPEGEAPVPQEG